MSSDEGKTASDVETLARGGSIESGSLASRAPRGSGLTSEQQVTDQERMRLRWQCRRGMLELDLLLNRFLDSGYAALDGQGRADFVRLLGYSDQILQDWLVGQAVPADPALCRLITAIQHAMRAREP
ncbi:succinate dehydrogenase assembly factor 2 [Halochromatium glycolicum]